MYWIITPDWLEDELEDGFEQLTDTHKMTLFSKKIKKKPSELERSRWNKFQYHEVPTVLYLSLAFLFRMDGACFFQPNNLKKCYVQVKGISL